MGKLGTLTEWSRFLDTRTAEDAQAQLTKYANDLDEICAQIGRLVLPMWQSPTGEVAEVLMIARTAVCDAIQMLEAVRGRFGDGPEAA
jgi:hypothetical protein